MKNFLDRTGIRIIKPLLKWYLEDENLQYDDEFYHAVEDLYVNYNLDFESWVDFVLEEYPSMEQVGSTFDLEYTWKQFQDTKEGKKFYIKLYEYKFYRKIDIEEFEEIIDFDTEIPYVYDSTIDNQFYNFFQKNKLGKKLSFEEKNLIVRAFTSGEPSTFVNGFTLFASDFAKVEAIDDDGNSVSKVTKIRNSLRDKYIVYTYNREFKGREVYYLVTIDIEEIAKNILKK